MGGPNNRDYSVLEYILGSPIYGHYHVGKYSSSDRDITDSPSNGEWNGQENGKWHGNLSYMELFYHAR